MSDHDPCCSNGYPDATHCVVCRGIRAARADEREKNKPLYTAALMQHMQDRLDLRAKVDALRGDAAALAKECDAKGYTTAVLEFQAECMAYDTVLALFDGSSDD